jgi:multidrug resistance efflux pump
MDLLLLLTYFSVCWAIFKIFKIPVNQWSLTTVVLGAIFFLGTLLSIMHLYHPASVTARTMFTTTPIVPNVRGKVIEVNVKPNVPLKAGDVLFKIDPVPFQAEVDRLTSELELSKSLLSDARALVKARAGRQDDVDRYRKDVKALSAQLVNANFNLESTVVRAPSDGFVTHLRLREGTMAVPMPLAPVMTFIHTEKPFFMATFTQQSMQTIKEGNLAEVMFPGIPGRVFNAKVVTMMPALTEGQLAPSATMINTRPTPEGLILIQIELTDSMEGYYIPLGSYATVAVYSEDFHHITIMRKIILRMLSWSNYVRIH